MNTATVAAFQRGTVLTLLAWGLVSAPLARAQFIGGTAPSVTSQNFGGHANRPSGIAPSVTSLGFNHVPGTSGTYIGGRPANGHGPRHPHNGLYGYGYGGYYVPYGYGFDDSYDQTPPEAYDGGPTIFDRRGNGTPAPQPAENSYQPQNYASQQEQAPVANQPDTILVFKDGHQFGVSNYAIVGSTLYDLSQGRRSKISLSALDIPATAKLNDDRGVEFQVPNAGTDARPE